MSKVISVLTGLVLMALGVWGLLVWRDEVIGFAKAVVAILGVLIGLGVLVFGLSELRPEDRTGAPPAPAPPPGDVGAAG